MELENPEDDHIRMISERSRDTPKTGVMAAENSSLPVVFTGLMGSAWLSDLTAPAVLSIISAQFEFTFRLVTVGGDGGCVSACAWMERSQGATTQHWCIVGNSPRCDVVEMVSLVIRVSWECTRCPEGGRKPWLHEHKLSPSVPMNYESAFQESFGLWSAVISSYGLVVLASVQPIIW